MTGIYVLHLAYSNGTAPSSNTQANTNLSGLLTAAKGASRLEVRAGYFGYCVRDAGVNWICSSDGAALLDQFGPDQDPLNIVWTMNQFQSRVLFSGLMWDIPLRTLGRLMFTIKQIHVNRAGLLGSAPVGVISRMAL